jgi:recombination protein RecA
MYGEGISVVGDLLDIGVEAGIIDKSGAWYSYNGERIGQGRENVKNFLTDNPDMATSINEQVRASVGIVKKTIENETEEDTERVAEKAK